MAEPLANFYFEFMTEGLAPVKDGIDDLNKKMDALTEKSEKSTKGVDGLFAGFKKLLPEIGLVATAYKALHTVMSLKDEIVDMQNFSTAVGVGADKIEGMGRALFQFGGDWKSAANLFGNITDMMEQLRLGQLDKAELTSIYGVDIVTGLLAGDHMGVLQGISNAMVGKNAGQQRAIARGFLGGDQSLQLFFGQGWEKVKDQLDEAIKKNFKSDPEYQRNSRALKQEIHELKEAWERSVAPLMPGITALLDAIQPIFAALQPLFSSIGNLLQVISPLVSWVAEKIGKGIQEVANTINEGVDIGKAAGKVARGEMSGEEFLSLVKSGKGSFGKTARATESFVNSIDEQYILNRGLSAWEDINAGTYDMADVLAAYSWLNAPSTQKQLSFDQVQTTLSVLRGAMDSLNNPTNNDNRSVSIETINVYGDNSTASNIGNNIGSAIKNGITNTVLEPAYNARGGW